MYPGGLMSLLIVTAVTMTWIFFWSCLAGMGLQKALDLRRDLSNTQRVEDGDNNAIVGTRGVPLPDFQVNFYPLLTFPAPSRENVDASFM
jgi:hypothetical protein